MAHFSWKLKNGKHFVFEITAYGGLIKSQSDLKDLRDLWDIIITLLPIDVEFPFLDSLVHLNTVDQWR